jgi:hypothetical protein
MKRKRGVFSFDILNHAVHHHDSETLDLICSSGYGVKASHDHVSTDSPRILRKLLKSDTTSKHVGANTTLLALMGKDHLDAFKTLLAHPTASYVWPGLLLKHALKQKKAKFVDFLSELPTASLVLPEFTQSRLSPGEIVWLQGHGVPGLTPHSWWRWYHAAFRFLRRRVKDNVLLLLMWFRRINLYKDVRLLLVDYYIKSEIH